MTTTSPAPLTFGDTFTLPATGDAVWTIRDMRPDVPGWTGKFEYLTGQARTVGGEFYALYYLGEGWRQGTASDGDRNQLTEQLNALDVHLPRRTPAEWVAFLRPTFESQARTDVGAIIESFGPSARAVNSDTVDLRATLAAVSACVAAGAPADPESALYRAVAEATATAIRSAL